MGLSDEIARMKDFEKGDGDYPPSDVLKYWFKDGSWMAIRPSGTEPKTKVYYCIHDNNKEAAEAALTKRKALIENIINSI